MEKELGIYDECVNCRTRAKDAKNIITGGYLADEEWACSNKCYDEWLKEAEDQENVEGENRGKF